MSFFTKLFGDYSQKTLKRLQPLVLQINGLETDVKKQSDDDLREKMRKFQGGLQGKPWAEQAVILEKILPDVFAAVRDTARRHLGQRHYDVQLLGGMVLHLGKISEMKTGEGKTLTASLAVALNALAGRGVHVVTPNDYLSRVGGGWMGPVYHSLGLSVGVIAHEFSGIYDPDYETAETHGGDERLRHWRPVSRKEAYA